jgi:hypothetical protein
MSESLSHLELIDNNKAAGLLDVKPATLEQWRYRKKGPPFLRIGRSIRYNLSDLHAWVSGSKVAPAQEATEK